MVARLALSALLFSSLAHAASISGTIADTGAMGLAGLEVRLWVETPKGFTLQSATAQTVLSGAGGAYAFTNIPAGNYKVDARMPPGFGGNWGDRWYDVAPPTGNGYVPQDADVLTLAASDALTSIDITLEVNGGFDGRAVSTSVAPLTSFFARAELMSDRRIHHNDVTKADAIRPGQYSMRGLVIGPTRLVLHDPNFVYADTVQAGFGPTAAAPYVGDLAMPLAPADPTEPNDTRTAANAGIDGGLFHETVPQAFVADGTIAPRNAGDVDWFCFDALQGDRYLVTAQGTLTLEDSSVVESPWVDPVVSFWRDDLGSLVAEDDDSGPLALDSRLDTGLLANGGRYCVGVTTFGDSTWAGATQGSAGPYRLRIAMGNRAPVLSVTTMGQPTPPPPQTITIAEGESVTFDLTFVDPDGNLSSASYELRDATSNLIDGASLTGGVGSVTFSASQTAARAGPYTLVVTVSDGEFTRTVTAVVVVTTVNFAPDVPTLVAPDGGASVATRTPTLVCAESFDRDEETLTYEFELTAGDAGMPTQVGSVVGVDGGWNPDGGLAAPLVAYAATALPENAWVSWRVRAFDGTAANGHSPWSTPWTFRVDSINDPPTTPILKKPTDGETVMLRRPTLEASSSTDPEDEAVTLTFQVATDVAFTNLVLTSPAVPVTGGAVDTMWTVTQDLAWGGAYFARVTASDTRGGQSAVSNINAFQVRANESPAPASLGAPFASCGSGVTLTGAPTGVTIAHVTDLEQDPITIEVRLFRASDDPATATPLFSQSVQQQGTAGTTVAFTGVTFQEDASYRVRARTLDGLNTTAWVECVFTVDALPPEMDAGMGGGGGTTGGGGGATGGGPGTGGGVASGGGSGTGGAGMGGGDATGGGSATGGGDGQQAPTGCHCAVVDPLLPLGLGLALLLRRRRG